MLQIFYKEVNSFFCSLAGYVSIACYIVIIGLLLWILPDSNLIDSGFASLEVFFSYSPYIIMILAPAITMHMICEERRNDTLELLLSAPVNCKKIVYAKFFAASIIVLFILFLSLINYLVLWMLCLPKGCIDSAVIFGSYLGLFLLSMLFCAIGLLASSYSSSQLVSFIAGVLLCLFLFKGLEELKNLVRWSPYAFFIYKISAKYNYELLSRGVIDIKNFVYFLYAIGMCLWIAIRKLNNYCK